MISGGLGTVQLLIGETIGFVNLSQNPKKHSVQQRSPVKMHFLKQAWMGFVPTYPGWEGTAGLTILRVCRSVHSMKTVSLLVYLVRAVPAARNVLIAPVLPRVHPGLV